MAEASADSTCGPGAVLPHGDGWAFALEVEELVWVRAQAVVEDAFAEQVEVCASLGTRRSRRLAYQLTGYPDTQHPALGRVELHLIGWASSKADAAEFCDDLADLLVSLDHLAVIRTVLDETELERVLDPVPLLHLAEVRQRDTCLTSDDSDGMPSERGDSYFVVTMVEPSPNDLHALCERLLYQEAPVVVRVAVVPTELSARERDGVWSPLHVEGDSSLTHLIRRLEGGIERLQAFTNLYPTYDIQVLVASTEHISETLKATIATSISQSGRAGGPLLAGQPEVIELDEVAGRAQEAFETLQPTALRPTSAPEPLARLHRIVGPSQLACFMRMPIATGPQFPGMTVQPARTVEAPLQALTCQGTSLGTAQAQGQSMEICWPNGDRGRHVYAVGQTGTGKSTLLAQMILQDITAGRGVAVLDPHGDLIDHLLERLPDQRLEDVVLFDPADPAFRLSLSPLDADSDVQRDFIIQDLGEMFYALYDPERSGIVGPRFESWLRVAALTLIDSAEAGPARLEDIPRLFSDDEFLKQRFRYVTNEQVQRFWINEMGKTSDYHRSEMLGWFSSKFDSFKMSPIMRGILGKGHNDVSFRSLMDDSAILLVNLAKGAIGEVNSRLLGFFVVARIWSAALGRIDETQSQRVPFTLYLDEFQSFTTSALDTMLSEGRKFGLELVLANQFFAQLRGPVREAIFGNVGTKMIFRVGARDAALLEEHVRPEFDAQDLLYNPNFVACCSMLADGTSLRPFTLKTVPPIAAVTTGKRSRLKQAADVSAAWGDPPDGESIMDVVRRLTTPDGGEPEDGTPAGLDGSPPDEDHEVDEDSA